MLYHTVLNSTKHKCNLTCLYWLPAGLNRVEIDSHNYILATWLIRVKDHIATHTILFQA